MEVKIIEVLNAIASGGKKPKEIRFRNYTYQLHERGYYRSVIDSNWVALTTDYDILDILNEFVEIKQETDELISKIKIQEIIDNSAYPDIAIEKITELLNDNHIPHID